MPNRKISTQAKGKLRALYPELRILPDDWNFVIDTDEDEVFYYIATEKKEVITRDHPKFGKLPEPWMFKMVGEGTGKVPKLAYYNRETRKTTRADPRFSADTLENLRNMAQRTEGLEIASSLRRSCKAESMADMDRQPIGKTNIRSKYEIMHTIDSGDGEIGAMNGGVFKSAGDCLHMGYKETEMLRRLKHGSVSMYTAGFIDFQANIGSVYVEFCDGGSLNDVWDQYNCRNTWARKYEVLDQKVHLPEGFLWHVLIGLVDGLAYLANGRYYVSQDVEDTEPAKDWIPVLHRDIKPENILLRSRDTIGSRKYPYCVLSDFGLATDDLGADHPKADHDHLSGLQCGTPTYYAPELCWNTRLQPSEYEQQRKFPPGPGSKHTRASDLWAVGACVFNLAMAESPAEDGGMGGNYPYAHAILPVPDGVPNNIWWRSQASRRKRLDIGDELGYSPELRKSILYMTQWDPAKRPGAAQLVQILKKMVKAAGHDRMPPEELPDWAFKVHDYHSAMPRPAED
ncbi:hypothetical protein WAI453_000643 [Rhynchosporium graminicola]|uniref:non-specific serine/threonine protein kinase n=1 Tax=Rhynchosporium graminicola TaxID=2792576 RepID=A0A1E1JRE8_9HELO|nr:uncharacterized protein RCO7_01181 [Rhynchosporium commune]